MNEVPNLDTLTWSDIAPTFLRVSLTAYKNRKLLDHWYKKCQVFLGAGSTNVIVLGRENVGKTVLIQQLNEEASKISYDLPVSSKSVESSVVTFGQWSKIVRVIPGQSSKARYEGLTESFHENPSLEGVIYVTDWGLTDVRDELVKQSLVDLNNIKTIKELQDYNLKLELSDFEIVCQEIIKMHTKHNYGPKWIIVATNKVDLFYKDINSAQKYYHPLYSSEFSKTAKNLINNVGIKNLSYKSLPICAWEKDFVWNGQTIKTKLGGNTVRQSLFKHMIANVAQL